MNEGRQYSIHSLCRICLNHLQNDAAYDLYLVPGLSKKLCFCTSLSVEQNDGFPKNLCTLCYTKLNELHDFQRQCVDSVQKFQDLVASNVFACQSNFDVLDPNVAVQDYQGEDEDHVNYDPLLNHKMELIENEEDVFKMLEHVDKEAEEVENGAKVEEDDKGNVSIKMFDDDSSIESGNDNDHDLDFEPNSSDDDIPLAQRMRGPATGSGYQPSRSSSQNKPKPKPRGRPKKIKPPPPDEEYISGSSSESDDSEDGNSRGDKPKRKRIPMEERHLHRIIDCHICHQKFKKAIRYEEHMKYHNDLLPFQCKVETCKKGMEQVYNFFRSGCSFFLTFQVSPPPTGCVSTSTTPTRSCPRYMPASPRAAARPSRASAY